MILWVTPELNFWFFGSTLRLPPYDEKHVTRREGLSSMVDFFKATSCHDCFLSG